METRLDIQNELQPMLMAVSTSSYFTVARIQKAISRANLWAGDEFPWPNIKKGFITDSVAGQPYYDYPSNCQSESIFKMSLDGLSDFTKKDFEEYLKFKEEEPSSIDKYFSEYGRQIFFTPPATTDGTANLIFWGLIQAGEMGADVSETMFSGWSSSTNEGVLLRAYAYLIKNIDPNKANDAIAEAKSIINKAYLKIAKRQQRKQMINKSQFDLPDLFGSGIIVSNSIFGGEE